MFHVLKTFLSVYETHNFTRSADSLFLSQPTVSAQIKKLEEQVGVKLFIRNGKQEIVPTKEAIYLYPKLVKIIDEWEDAIAHISTQHNVRQTCSVACSDSYGTSLLSALAPELITHFPSVDFSFVVLPDEEIVFALESSNVHFGLAETPGRSTRIERELLTSNSLVLAGNSEDEQWILPDLSTLIGKINESYLNMKKINPKVIRTNSQEMTLSLLKNGVGQTIIPRITVDSSIVYQAIESEFEYTLYFLSKKSIVSTELEAIAEFIQTFIQSID